MSQSTVNQTAYLLIVAHGNGSHTNHPLQPGCSIFVGSSNSCGIHVQGQDVAAKHCLVDLNDGVVSIQDWVSPTGTFVNGQAIESKVAVTAADKITVGAASLSICSAKGPAPVADREEPPGNVETANTADTDTDEYATVYDLNVKLTDEPAAEQSLEDLETLTEELLDESCRDDDDEVNGWNDDALPADNSGWNALPNDDDDDDLDDDRSPAVAWHDQADDFGSDVFGQYDQQTVDLLKAEIDDLRSLLAERDAQIHELSQEPTTESTGPDDESNDADDRRLQSRVDELIAEAAEHDERIEILQDLLHAGEVKNQAEAEERQALEAWVGEIEHRIGQRESEWKAELEALKNRAAATVQERDQLQHQLRQVASRFDAANAYQETLDTLQTRNAKLQEQFEKARKQCVGLKQHLDNLKNRETDVLQAERAVIAKERASVSRMRFELSRKLNEFEAVSQTNHQTNDEASLRLQTLRSHLREIHQQEQEERSQKGESLISRISGLWKRMDYEY